MGVNGQFDPLVRMGLGHADLNPLLVGEEPLVHGGRHPGRDHDVAVLVRHDQPQFAGHEGDAAAQNAAATQRGAVLLAPGIPGRIDEDRALGDAASRPL